VEKIKFATKEDLQSTETKLRQEIQGSAKDIKAEFRQEIRLVVEDAKVELRAEIHDLRTEMKQGFSGVNQSIVEIKDLLQPTTRALDIVLLDVRNHEHRLTRLERRSKFQK
jgi:F0F1-type ATP synthase membrane subunit b/b'